MRSKYRRRVRLLSLFLTMTVMSAAATSAHGQDVDVFAQDTDVFAPRPDGSDADTPAEAPSRDGSDQSTNPLAQPGAPATGQYISPEARQAYEQGQQLFDQGDFAGAIQQFNVALGIDQRFVPALIGSGRAYAELGFDDLAIQRLMQAVLYGRSLPDSYFELGKVYMEVDPPRYREAEDYLRQALEMRPDDPEYLYQFGLAIAELGYTSVLGTGARESLNEAVKAFDRAISLKADYADAYFERGSALLQLGELDDSIEDLERASELNPSKPDVIAQLGFARLQRAGSESSERDGKRQQIIQDYEAAIEAFSRYFSVAPPAPAKRSRRNAQDKDQPEVARENVHVARAAAYVGLGGEHHEEAASADYQKAVEDTNQALALNPDLGTAYYQRGVAQRMMNELDAAIESFSEALETPETRAGQIQSEALLRRGIVWFRKGDYRLALQDFADASGFSRDPRASFWEGLAHAQMGNFEAAVSAYSLALQDRPVFSMAHMNRGLAYMHLGRYERAIEDFNQVLRRDRDHRQARAQRERAVQMLRRLASR